MSLPAPDDRARDEHIVQRIRSGSEEGLRLLIEAYGERVKGALRKKMQTYDPSRDALIEDAMTDAMISFCMRIGSIGELEGSPIGWLLVVARNNYISKLREEKVRPLLKLMGEEKLEAWASRNGAPVPRSEQQARLLEDLLACIDKLGPLQREIILSDLDEDSRITDEELGRKLNTSANSIRVSRHKAHKRLRKLMKKRSSK